MRALVVGIVILAASARAEALDETKEREARAHFEQATRLYNVGDFDRAIAGYKRAYELSPAPGLLFNIGQAYRAKGDREHALYFYAAFLREEPDAPERAFVEARMAALRAAPPAATAATTVAVEDSGSTLRKAGAVTVGVGSALVIAGLVFAVQAHGAFDEAAMSGDPDPGKSSGTRAIIFTGAGMATMVTGGIMFYVGSRPVSVAPTIGNGGAGVTAFATF